MHCSINLVLIAIKKGTQIKEMKRINRDLKNFQKKTLCPNLS